MTADARPLPTLFIPHGGGPCFFMTPSYGPPDLWDRLAAHLRGLAAAVGARPRAVLVVSGHWACPRPTVNAGSRPPLLFDYYGFPEHTYRLTYPAPGAPALAGRVQALLAGAGIASDAVDGRGFDHGVFVPFLLVYPEADMPILQLSLRRDMDPEAHLALGRALAPLRREGVLIVGSGMSYHNLRDMFADTPRANAAAQLFDDWLDRAVTEPDPERRDRLLAGWAAAPAALACHPSPEHLIPLLVAAGAAGADQGRRTYHDRILGKALSGFRFG